MPCALDGGVRGRKAAPRMDANDFADAACWKSAAAARPNCDAVERAL